MIIYITRKDTPQSNGIVNSFFLNPLDLLYLSLFLVSHFSIFQIDILEENAMKQKIYDNIIIGGGQAGLSVAYFFRRSQVDYLILDDQKVAGGSWQHSWDSLKLFSPVVFSSLSGWMMPQGKHEYPDRDEFIDYLQKYEKRYAFPIQRPVIVSEVTKQGGLFVVQSDQGKYISKTLVSATGNAQNPFIPTYSNIEEFIGRQLHSSEYLNPNEFEGQKVLIIGGGNSGAQILAEVSKVADTDWVTVKEPEFLPEYVDGRYLFQKATEAFLGKPSVNSPKFSLGNIVMLDSVKDAFNRGVLNARGPFEEFYANGVVWTDGTKEKFDAVIWCTGFRSNLKHLKPLDLIENNRIKTRHTRSLKEPNLWLVGYGNWTGFASATIYGVGKTAKATAREIDQTLHDIVP